MQEVKLKKVGEIEVEDKPLENLRDGGHTLFTCSNCNAKLMDVWSTRRHEADEWTLQATCPFCNDRSFEKQIKGGFHYGGFGTTKPGEPDEDDYVSTKVDFWETVNEGSGDKFLFHIIKASPDAKPCR
jgi:DNA-directed RNA polymerase subunit RPC12/RpoP